MLLKFAIHVNLIPTYMGRTFDFFLLSLYLFIILTKITFDAGLTLLCISLLQCSGLENVQHTGYQS